MEQIKFSSITEQWLCECRKRTSQSTLAKYEQLIKDYINPALGDVESNKINMERINSFFTSFKKVSNNSHPLSVSTCRIILMIVNNILSFGYQNGLIEEHLYLKPCLSKKKPVVETFSEADQQKLEEYIFSRDDHFSFAIILALYTGMRIGEICALKWGDIDLAKGSIKVERTVQRLPVKNEDHRTQLIVSIPKSSSSYRIIPISEYIQEYIIRQLSKNTALDNYCFSNDGNSPMEPRTLQYAYRRILNILGIPYLNFHCLRHTFATRCVMCGWDIKSLSEVLGHSDIKITLEYYFHSSFEYKKEQMNKLRRIS